RFTLTDDYDNVGRRGTIKVFPPANALDLIVTEGAEQKTTLQLRYDLKDDTLRLASNEANHHRPVEMKTTDGSAILIYTFRREKPRIDDKEQLQGTWTVSSHDSLGEEASPESINRRHQWIFAGDRVTIRDKDGIQKECTFRLNRTAKPRAMDL